MNRRQLRVLSFACIAASIPAATTLAGIDVLVKTGDPLPDGNGQFSIPLDPALNNNGQYSFLAQLSGTSSPPNDAAGFYRGGPNGLVKVARFGDAFDGSQITGFFPFGGYLDATGTVNGNAILADNNRIQNFYGDGVNLTTQLMVGSASPGGNNSLRGASSSVTNDAGTSVYKAIYDGANEENGLYQRFANGTIETSLLVGDPVPNGGTFEFFGSRPTINESNEIGVAWNTSGQSTSVLRIDGASKHEFLRNGDMLSDGITTVDEPLGMVLINNNSTVAFGVKYSQPGAFSRTGIVLADDNSAQLIAPSDLPGSSLNLDTVIPFGISDTGSVAFHGDFGFSGGSGIYVADDSEVKLIAFTDTPTPDGDDQFFRFSRATLAMNDVGQIAFRGEFRDPANQTDIGSGVYLYDEVHGLEEIIRSGDAFDGSTVSHAYFIGSTPSSYLDLDNSHSGLNEQGDVAFAYELEDGTSGIALWSRDTALVCDLDGDGDCGHDDLDALYATGDVTSTQIQDWLAAASSPTNTLNPSGNTLVVGDINLDGKVDSSDLGILLNDFNTAATVGWIKGDLNDDSIVNSPDLGQLLNKFNFGVPLSATVPEPDGVAVWCLTLLLFFARRPR